MWLWSADRLTGPLPGASCATATPGRAMRTIAPARATIRDWESVIQLPRDQWRIGIAEPTRDRQSKSELGGGPHRPQDLFRPCRMGRIRRYDADQGRAPISVIGALPNPPAGTLFVFVLARLDNHPAGLGLEAQMLAVALGPAVGPRQMRPFRLVGVAPQIDGALAAKQRTQLSVVADFLAKTSR